MTILCLSMWLAASALSGKGTMHAHAKTTISVQSSEAVPFDRTVTPALTEIRIRETFRGDIEGESTVRALQVERHDHSASLVSMQRFHGRLNGREGTFVLQVPKSSKTARSRRHGSSSPDRVPAI